MAHQEQVEFCQSVKNRFPEFFTGRFVLDVGSLDLNGNNLYLFEDCQCLGVDLMPGKNVDIVTEAHNLTLPSETFDVVISAECFEHDMYYEKTLQNIVRLLKPGGLFLFTCATTGRAEHGTRRSLPDNAPFLESMEEWGDYYKNLTEKDIRQAIDVKSIFESYEFSVNPSSHDLYFWGKKVGTPEHRSDYSHLLKASDSRKEIERVKHSLLEYQASLFVLSQGMVERDSQIGVLTQALKESKLKASDSRKEIERVKHSLLEYQASLFVLSQGMVERDSQIGVLTQALKESKLEVSRLSKDLTKSKKKVVELDKRLLNRDRDIDMLSRKIVEQENRSYDLDRVTHEQVTQLQTLEERENQISQLVQNVSEQTTAIEVAQNSISEFTKSLHEHKAIIAEIYATTSWYITKPIRYVGSYWKKAKVFFSLFRRTLQRKPPIVLFNKLMTILRREGVKGLRYHFKQELFVENQVVNSRQVSQELSSPLESESEKSHDTPMCYPQEGKVPTPWPQGYVYEVPERPTDLDDQMASLQNQPLFSIVVPAYNTPPDLLCALLESVESQWYTNWELILADDASPSKATIKALNQIDHPKVRVVRLKDNEGISGATNAAIDASRGDFIVFLDHDDELTVDCLYELALCIERENPDYIYSDEDKLSESGRYVEPHFKPDWSPDTLMSSMFVCHVSCVRASLVREVGRLRPEFDGSQDWDFILRVTEKTDRIAHIPKVLYHWRIIPNSAASDIMAKPYAIDASKAAREDALKRRGLRGVIEPIQQVPGYSRVAYHMQGTPLISIIIPTRDNEEVLRRCIDSILKKSDYKGYELIILDNGSVNPSALNYLKSINQMKGVRVIRHDFPFNFSELCNVGAKESTGELLLFLNDDTEVLQNDWLERLAGYAQLSHVGAVGAKLLYPDQTVQHSGVLNLKNGPDHAFRMFGQDTPGYFMRNLLEYNWIAVTGACLMIDKKKFEEMEGFAECLAVAYNDVDLCMRLNDTGYYNIVCQAVSLVHHESVSRGNDIVDSAKTDRLTRERTLLFERNPKYHNHDPFHNPNLHRNGPNFDIAV